MGNRSKKIMRMAMIATVILLAVVTPFSASAAESNCTLWSFNGFFQCLLGGVGLIFEWIIIPFLTLFVQITGSLFDFSVKTALDTSFIRGLAAIKDGWVIIRDVINMAFIFIILFIAIATILNISKYHMKQTLARLIIAAVLINFSFFVTGVIIDAGNVVAQGFYTPLVTQVKDAEGNTRLPSETLMGLLRVHTFWDTDSAMKNMQGLGLDAETPPDKKLSGTPYFMNALMRMILLAIIAYVFLVAAVLFIGRTIAFLFLLMLSPIGFIGDVIPGAGAAASKWWKTLIGQTLVAPIFLMFLYIIFLIAGALYPEIQKLSVGGVDANSPNITIFFNYALLIGLILMALKITKNVSGEVGAMTIKWAKIAGTVVAGAGLAAGVGVTAVAGRAVVGAAASRAAASGGLRTLATTQAAEGSGRLARAGAAVQRGVGRTGLAAANRLADAGYDVRTSGLFQRGARMLGLTRGAETVGLSLRRRREDAPGYRQRQREAVEVQTHHERQFAASIGLTPREQARERELLEQRNRIRTQAETRTATSTGEDRGRMAQERQNIESYRQNIERTTGELHRAEADLQAGTNLRREARTAADQTTAQEMIDRATRERDAARSTLASENARIQNSEQNIGRYETNISSSVERAMGQVAEEMGVSMVEIEQGLQNLTQARQRAERYAGQVEQRGLGREFARRTPSIAAATVGGTVAGGAVAGPIGAAVGAAIAGGLRAAQVWSTGLNREQNQNLARLIREDMTRPGGYQPPAQRRRRRGGDVRSMLDVLSEDAREELLAAAREEGGTPPPPTPPPPPPQPS